MARITIALLLIALLGPLQARPVAAQDCQFVLGFKALHDLIPDIVGNCVADETHNPQNGDGLQQTTGGLLVWRKSDNWTAFTDGATTWVNGPLGLQQRGNDQRFWWEANPDALAIVPQPQPGDRCHTAGLALAMEQESGAAGHVGATFRFTNRLGVPCTFYGYPGAQLLDSAGNALPTNVVRGGFVAGVDPGPATVSVPAGGSAIFVMAWGQIPVGSETDCPTSDRLAVTPPDEYVSLSIPAHIRACNGGELDTTALHAG